MNKRSQESSVKFVFWPRDDVYSGPCEKVTGGGRETKWLRKWKQDWPVETSVPPLGATRFHQTQAKC